MNTIVVTFMPLHSAPADDGILNGLELCLLSVIRFRDFR